MKNHFLDLTIPEHAYMFGFMQTDGHLSKLAENNHKGTFKIEINQRDEHILHDFIKWIPYNYSIRTRTRHTNFKQNATTVTLSVSDQHFREELHSLGIPYGKKDEIIAPPQKPFSRIDYFRGVIDGNGSLGLTAQDKAFISLAIKSTALYQAYTQFLQTTIGVTKHVRKNSRDNMYNVVLYNEDAQHLIRLLYYPECLALHRKQLKATQVLQWNRPQNKPKRLGSRQVWSAKDDAYIMTHTIPNAMHTLHRTKQSITCRLQRIRIKQKLGTQHISETPINNTENTEAITPTADIIDKIIPVLNMKDSAGHDD